MILKNSTLKGYCQKFYHIALNLPVEVALVHVLLLGDTSDKDPQTNHDEDALPHGSGDLVPHLLVEEVDLLKSLEVVLTRGSVGDGPHAEIVHVSHEGPVVAEGHLGAWPKELVLVLSLAVVAADAEGVTESEALVLQEWSQLVHLIINLIIFYYITLFALT